MSDYLYESVRGVAGAERATLAAVSDWEDEARIAADALSFHQDPRVAALATRLRAAADGAAELRGDISAIGTISAAIGSR